MSSALLLSFEVRDGEIMPRCLGSRDLPWVRALVDEIDAFVGEPISRLDDAWASAIAPRLLAQGAPRRALDGALAVLRQRYVARIRAVARPAELRAALFEEAAISPGAEDAALARASAWLSLAPEIVLRDLFADLPGARIIVAPEIPVSPDALILGYNLALVQGLLLRATSLVAHVREHARSGFSAPGRP